MTIDDIAARHAASTPGEWEFDSIKGEDGNGTFTAYAVLGPDGKSLVDTGNSESIELHTEYDEDEFGTHVSVWDEIGRRNIQFIAHAHQDIPFLLAEITKLTAALADAEARGRLATFKEVTMLLGVAARAADARGGPGDGWRFTLAAEGIRIHLGYSPEDGKQP